jgi:small subunit ribosomal protein S35
MTAERKAELEEYRRQTAMKDQRKAITGQIIDGMMQIEQGLNKPALVREAIPELVMAGKRVAVRR